MVFEERRRGGLLPPSFLGADMRRCLFLLHFVLFWCCSTLCVAADWHAAVPSTSAFSPSARVDSAAYYALGARAAYLAASKHYSGSALRYVNHTFEFDSDAVLQLDQRLASDYGTTLTNNVYISEIRPRCLLMFDNPSLANQGNLYIYALVDVRVLEPNAGDGTPFAVVPVCEAFRVSNVVYNQITVNNVDSLQFEILTAQEFPFPVYLSTTANNDHFHFSFYFNRNIQSYSGVTSLIGGNYQNANIAYQTPQSWLNAWITGFARFATDDLGKSSLLDILRGNKFVSLHDMNNSYSYISSNLLGFSQEPAGYMTNMQPGNFAGFQSIDYDTGGQLDISEYLLGSDMKDPSDDNPNQAQSVSDIIQVTPPSVPGENTIYPDVENQSVDELVDETDGETQIDNWTGDMNEALQENAGYQLLKTLINPNGFNTSAELPRYEIPFEVNLGDFHWTLPNFVIDFNWLRESEYWNVWQSIRTILTMCLFVMTFVGCYQIYERMLKYSA